MPAYVYAMVEPWDYVHDYMYVHMFIAFAVWHGILFNCIVLNFML